MESKHNKIVRIKYQTITYLMLEERRRRRRKKGTYDKDDV
jgi:hypothetical protein